MGISTPPSPICVVDEYAGFELAFHEGGATAKGRLAFYWARVGGGQMTDQADQTIKIGDIVRLKSGGPLMTVTDIAQRDGKTLTWVAWFDRDGRPSQGTYPTITLVAAENGQTQTHFA
jgi:uncharacterized protein YodC (DUF2158 family)